MRTSLLAVAIVVLPGLALAQAPAASNPKLAAYAGHSCSISYPNGITVWDDFSIQGGNVVTRHHSKTPRATQDAGVISPTPVGNGSYRFTPESGSVFTLHPHDSTATIGVTIESHKGGVLHVTYHCK